MAAYPAERASDEGADRLISGEPAGVLRAPFSFIPRWFTTMKFNDMQMNRISLSMLALAIDRDPPVRNRANPANVVANTLQGS